MSLLSLPDIAGMLVLMGVLDRLRNRHQDERVDGWLLGLTYILVAVRGCCRWLRMWLRSTRTCWRR
jgi:hypothetical protein